MMDEYVIKDNKKLRKGYTTGSCAAAASWAAVHLLLSGDWASEVQIRTPKGVSLTIPVETLHRQEDWARCSVRKDSGDDPDVTDGTLVYAKVFLTDEPGQVIIDGGTGVGRVTKPGLACPVGEAAINPVPRQMIDRELRRAAEEAHYRGGIFAEISIPAGRALAARTFNPKLGIEGGISILGTTGIVEPMSEQALIDTIKVEINVQKAAGRKYLVVTPGNYGKAFLEDKTKIKEDAVIKCSNFIGDTLIYARTRDISGVLLAGHIGKLSKVAAGVMNTHSKYGDGRITVIMDHAARQGAPKQVIRQLAECVTTEDALAVLNAEGKTFTDKIMDSLVEAIHSQVKRRIGETMKVEVVLYSNVYGKLGATEGADRLLAQILEEERD